MMSACVREREKKPLPLLVVDISKASEALSFHGARGFIVISSRSVIYIYIYIYVAVGTCVRAWTPESCRRMDLRSGGSGSPG